ncbi:MAG: hypothetical protein ACO1NX_06705 [Chitinophagaceae bacterium]
MKRLYFLLNRGLTGFRAVKKRLIFLLEVPRKGAKKNKTQGLKTALFLIFFFYLLASKRLFFLLAFLHCHAEERFGTSCYKKNISHREAEKKSGEQNVSFSF